MTTFNTAPLTKPELEANPNAQDWGISLTEASAALRELEDAVPASDAQRTAVAHERLSIAIIRLGEFLRIRGLVV